MEVKLHYNGDTTKHCEHISRLHAEAVMSRLKNLSDKYTRDTVRRFIEETQNAEKIKKR